MDRWERFNNFVYFMLKLAYINVLWILFTVLGLGIFGLFPATTAMFSLVHKVINGQKKMKIFSTFWKEYKSNFFKTNGMGLIFLFVVYFLYFDFMFLHVNSGKLQFLYPILILITVSTLLCLSFFFPVYIRFKLTFLQYFKQAFLIAITSPIEVIQLGLVAVGISTATYFLPGIIPLFPASVFAYFSLKICNKALEKIELKQAV